MSASVSRLARWRPRKLAGGELGAPSAATGPLPESIWKGNEPRPFDIVDDCDAVDIPSCLRLGGGGSGESGVATVVSVAVVGVAVVGVAGVEAPLVEAPLARALLKACWASGERGGVRIGLSEIGDGGTKGKPSRMESARVDVELMTDERDMRVSSSSNARRCCSSSAPRMGESSDVCGATSFALVMRCGVRGVPMLSAALMGVCGTSLADGTPSMRGDACIVCCVAWLGDSLSSPRCTREAVPNSAEMIEPACVMKLSGRLGACVSQFSSLSPYVAIVDGARS